MLDFYEIVRQNLHYNRFEHENTVCLEYTCPLDADELGIYSRCDYVVHVLSGKKTFKTFDGEWTLHPGETLYLKKGAELVRQFFENDFCMLGFIVTDDLIRETYNEVRGALPLAVSADKVESSVFEVHRSAALSHYFESTLAYFRSEHRPPDPVLLLKVKELLITLMSSDADVASYFGVIATSDRPSIQQIMDKNFCYNLKLEEYADLCCRSLSSFKRDFEEIYHESPGRWLQQRRVRHAATLLTSTQLSITQVAFESGFADLSHFSRAFKRIAGTSPKEYRKDH